MLNAPRRPPPRPQRRRRLPATLVVLVVVVLAAGCGSADPEDGPVDPTGDGPRVAHPRFDGRFDITGLVDDGREVPLAERPSIEIDAEFGSLMVQPGCNAAFGSFTLDEDGGASFTITGGSDSDCGELAAQEDAILAALAATDRWAATDDGFRFDGARSSVTVVGPAG